MIPLNLIWIYLRDLSFLQKILYTSGSYSCLSHSFMTSVLFALHAPIFFVWALLLHFSSSKHLGWEGKSSLERPICHQIGSRLAQCSFDMCQLDKKVNIRKKLLNGGIYKCFGCLWTGNAGNVPTLRTLVEETLHQIDQFASKSALV